jgi:hypothetical protein
MDNHYTLPNLFYDYAAIEPHYSASYRVEAAGHHKELSNPRTCTFI